VWQRPVRTVDVAAGTVVVAGCADMDEPEPADRPADVLEDDVPSAGTSVVEAGEPAERGAEDVAADTEPWNEQPDSMTTASSTTGTGPVRRRQLVMAPR
jgi:hypothetical protein